MKHIKKLFFGVMSILLVYGCSKNNTSSLQGNLPPETDIFVSTLDSLNPTQSVQKIAWDGRDPDGLVVGFYYSWKEDAQASDWQFTTERSLTFPLKITGNDTSYVFQVKAVDDQGAEDPSPAKQRFPIKNSPPQLSWTAASRIPDTTFTVASFIWDATDLDGDSTIVRFEYALDGDTTNWRPIPGYLRALTLNADSGLSVGDHSFYLRAIDVAGAKSATIRMPENPAKNWYVKQPRGRYLLIDDYQSEDVNSGYPDRSYKQILDSVVVPLGEDYSYWNIEQLFPVSINQFRETLLLFDRVIWYTDISQEADNHFIAAQVAVPEFLQKGGKIIYSTIFTTNFGTQGDPLAFSPVSSISGSYRFFPGNIYTPQDDFKAAFPSLPDLPELKVSKFFAGVKALEPKASAIPLYRYGGTTTDDPLFIILGRDDNTGVYNFVFSATPLHQLNGNNNLNDFFDIILNQIFK